MPPLEQLLRNGSQGQYSVTNLSKQTPRIRRRGFKNLQDGLSSPTIGTHVPSVKGGRTISAKDGVIKSAGNVIKGILLGVENYRMLKLMEQKAIAENKANLLKQIKEEQRNVVRDIGPYLERMFERTMEQGELGRGAIDPGIQEALDSLPRNAQGNALRSLFGWNDTAAEVARSDADISEKAVNVAVENSPEALLKEKPDTPVTPTPTMDVPSGTGGQLEIGLGQQSPNLTTRPRVPSANLTPTDKWNKMPRRLQRFGEIPSMVDQRTAEKAGMTKGAELRATGEYQTGNLGQQALRTQERIKAEERQRFPTRALKSPEELEKQRLEMENLKLTIRKKKGKLSEGSIDKAIDIVGRNILALGAEPEVIAEWATNLVEALDLAKGKSTTDDSGYLFEDILDYGDAETAKKAIAAKKDQMSEKLYKETNRILNIITKRKLWKKEEQLGGQAIQ